MWAFGCMCLDLFKRRLRHGLGDDYFREVKWCMSRSHEYTDKIPHVTTRFPKYEEYKDFEYHPDVTYIVATGVHRAPSDEEYNFIFGDMYDECKDKIIAHDARKDEDMVYLGKSTNGTEMYLNKIVPEIGNVLVIGSAKNH